MFIYLSSGGLCLFSISLLVSDVNTLLMDLDLLNGINKYLLDQLRLTPICLILDLYRFFPAFQGDDYNDKLDDYDTFDKQQVENTFESNLPSNSRPSYDNSRPYDSSPSYPSNRGSYGSSAAAPAFFEVRNQAGSSANCIPKCFAEKGDRVNMYKM